MNPNQYSLILVALLFGAGIGRAAEAKSAEPRPAQAASAIKTAQPKLVDLGAGKCIPCKMMAPILDKLKKEYAGQMEVQFIDVWKDPKAGEAYGIKLIPTQIFYAPSGKELFRHEGFLGEEDILKKWKELGFTFNKPAPKPKSK